MSWFGRTIISSQVIKKKSDKLMKRALRDARKKIKRDELVDSHSLGLYLQTVDARFTHLQQDIIDATRTANYAKIRADKVAETRQLLDFFSHDHSELARLYQIVLQKAKDAQRMEDLKQEKLSAVDVTKLRDGFNSLNKKDEDD